MAIDMLFPRLVFNLTRAFRASTEKQAGLKTPDTEGGLGLYLALGLVLPEGAWGWALVVVSSDSSGSCYSCRVKKSLPPAPFLLMPSLPEPLFRPSPGPGWLLRSRAGHD